MTTKEQNEIIDCGGKYEVHPMAHGGYGVVNSESGDVRCTFSGRAEAVANATSLNNDHLAFAWAKAEQGFTGTYADWCDLSVEDRQEYEDGAAGIGTV